MFTSLWLRSRRGAALAAGLAAALGAGLVSTSIHSASAEAPPVSLQESFAAAAGESHVPEPLLLALSYQLTRWDAHGTEPSAVGGYGPMHLTDLTADAVRAQNASGRDDVQVDEAALAADESLHRAAAAARLLTADEAQVKADTTLNIRAGAALLAAKARALSGGELPSDLAGWAPSVAWYGGSPEATGANAFVEDVYESLRTGVTRTTNTGEALSLPATTVAPIPPIAPVAPKLSARALAPAPPTTPVAECPGYDPCRFIPAAYTWTNHADPNAYGNYDPANRPAEGSNKVRYIVIHDTEGSYNSTINAAQNPNTNVASHYVIRSSDGEITQMIATKDIGWHAGNWNINTESIGIEHEAVAREGATWYTEAMYRSSARLVKYLAKKYRIPLDRTHIIGHDDVEGNRPAAVAGAHWDPGPFWDWEHYMSLLGAPIVTDGGRVRAGDAVTITPHFAKNTQVIPSCSPLPCKDLPEQGSNFVYLRTEPRADAPLINDPALQSTGQPGRPHAEDWGNKAVAGRQYVAAEVQGEWVAIWYAGRKAWIHDPARKLVKRSCDGRKITPADGLTSIDVYGKAFPNANEYPPEVAANVAIPLQYKILAGQQYVAGERGLANNYYARFIDSNVARNFTVLMGKEEYLRVSLNHRWVFVKVKDVKFVG